MDRLDEIKEREEWERLLATSAGSKKQVGYRIALALKECGVSRSDACDILNECLPDSIDGKKVGVIDEKKLSAWITGTNAPPWSVLVKIAAICNTTVDWLLTGETVRRYREWFPSEFTHLSVLEYAKLLFVDMTRPLNLQWSVSVSEKNDSVTFTLNHDKSGYHALIAEIATKIQALQAADLSDGVYKAAARDIVAGYMDKAGRTGITKHFKGLMPFSFGAHFPNECEIEIKEKARPK